MARFTRAELEAFHGSHDLSLAAAYRSAWDAARV